MPTWNAETFIERTLASISAQTYPNLEVLISDDASSDRTAEICRRFASAHPAARLMRQTTRQGWIGNVNSLLSLARGDYFFFAFHDDPLEPEYVASLIKAIDGNPLVVLAFSDVQLDREDGATEVRAYEALEGVRSRLERARRIFRREGLWWIPNRGLFRAAAAAHVGGLYRHFAGEYSADLPWLLHLALLGEFVRVPRPLIRKTWRKAGLSLSWKETARQNLGVASACVREIWRSGIPMKERLLLTGEFAGWEVRRQWWRFAR